MKIENLIQAIRDSFVGAEHIYKNGSCWHFANILRQVFPKGDIVCTIDHCAFKLNGHYYDIEGEISPEKIETYAEKSVCNNLKDSKTEKIDLFNMIRSFKGI